MTIKGPKIDAQGRPFIERSDPERLDYVPRTLVMSTENEAPQADPDARPDPSKTRADFREEEFERLIAAHGKYTTWRKALICPCVTNSITGQTDFTCNRCDGSGFYYVDPIRIQAVILFSDKETNLYERAGLWLNGQAQITVSADHRLGHRDSIELRDSVMVFDELLTKGNRRGIRKRLPAGVDTGRYRIVNMVLAIFEDRNGAFVSLKQCEHFNLTSDGWIEWTPIGTALVPDGTTISVRYEYKPTYLIESFPHVWRDDVSRRKSVIDKSIALPINAVGRLDYLVDVNKQIPSTWEV